MPAFKHVIGIDFESYYDKDYSLSKKGTTTHDYIRDERWQCLGAGFKFERESAHYCHDAMEGVKRIDRLGWDKVALVAHNAMFDGSVLFERFGRRRPAMWFDTQLMARYLISQGILPPEQTDSLAKLAPLVGMEKGNTWDAVHGGNLTEYGTDDVIIMMKLLNLFLSHKIPWEELEYMDMHIRMATEPQLHTDKELLKKAATVTDQDRKLYTILRQDANMVTLLKRCGVEVEYKTTPKGKIKPALAKTDIFMQGLLEHENPLVAELASRRLQANSSITHTRAAMLLRVGDPLPCPYLYYAAHTGRGGGRDGYNMQNLPGKGPLRRAIVPPPGYVLVVGDSKQVEARTVAWRAGDENLLATFRTSDPYRTFGAQFMYQCNPEDLDETQRKIAKAGVLGLGFGQGWKGLAAQTRAKSGLIIPPETAELAVNAYRKNFRRVPKWWKQIMRMAREDGYVVMPDGRKIIYPDMAMEVWDEEEDSKPTLVFYRPAIFSKGVKRGERQRVRLWHGLATENDTQGSARSIVFWQALQMRREGINIVGLTHDEVIALSRIEEANDVKECMLKWFRTGPEWADGLPLDGDINANTNYLEAKP